MIKTVNRFALFVVALLFSTQGFSQVKFERIFGSTGYDYGYSVTQMANIGYAVAGSTTSFGSGSTDIYLLQTDSMGTAIRHKTFGGINIDRAYSIKSTNDSGLVIAGYTNSFGNGGYDIYVIKTDKNCDTIWTRTYGGADWDFAYSIEQTVDSGYIIAGGTYGSGSGNEDMFLVKTNSAGDTMWTKTYGGIYDDEAKSVKQTSDGGYILTGYTKSFGDASGDIYTIKTDSVGDTLWTYRYQGGMDDLSYDVLEDNTGAGYIISGESKVATLDFQGIIIRLTTAGSHISASTIYGSTASDGINAITQTSDGRFATIGYTYSYGSGASDISFYIEKPIGSFVGSRTFGGIKVDKGYSIENTKDGGFIICGTTLSHSTFERIYLIKTDSLGVSTGIVVNVVTGVNSVSASTENNLLVYPNPANDAFAIELNPDYLLLKTDLYLTITDVLGRTVYTKSIDSAEPILLSTEQFLTGMYLINVRSENFSANQKLIIQKN